MSGTSVELRFTGSGVLVEGKNAIPSGGTLSVSKTRAKQLLDDPHVDVEKVTKAEAKAVADENKEVK